jgi:hypothetical protein
MAKYRKRSFCRQRYITIHGALHPAAGHPADNCNSDISAGPDLQEKLD